MTIKTIQWNIGGGNKLRPGADPTLLSSYDVDGLPDIAAFLQEQNADVIALQETHSDGVSSSSARLATMLGYDYWTNDVLSDSHVQAGQKLGIGIISRYLITNHSFEKFFNPYFEVEWEDGSIAKSFDKGVTSCTITIDESELLVQSLHMIPFRRFKVGLDTDSVQKVFRDVETKVTGHMSLKRILLGDFNVNESSLRPILPGLFASGFEEIQQDNPTTPKGHHYDHVLYAGVDVKRSEVLNGVLTDHYPVVTEFAI